MRGLITGGAGFIGSHLSERLLNRGDHITIIDDLSTGSMHNIAGLRGHANFEYYLDSIFNRRLTAELVDMAEVVFHFAAAVGVRRIVDFPCAETPGLGSNTRKERTDPDTSDGTVLPRKAPRHPRLTEFPFMDAHFAPWDAVFALNPCMPPLRRRRHSCRT